MSASLSSGFQPNRTHPVCLFRVVIGHIERPRRNRDDIIRRMNQRMFHCPNVTRFVRAKSRIKHLDDTIGSHLMSLVSIFRDPMTVQEDGSVLSVGLDEQVDPVESETFGFQARG